MNIKENICVYYPPNNRKFDTSKELHSYIETLTSSHNSNIVLGDFNCPKIDWENQTTAVVDETPILEISTILNLQQIITSPTRERNILDLCFVSDSLIPDSQADVCPSIIKSDHEMIEFSFWATSTPQISTIPKYNYFKSDYDSINEELKEIKWNYEEWIHSNDMDKIYGEFRETFLNIVHKHTPKTPQISTIKYPAHIENLERIRKKLWSQNSDERSKRRYIRASIKYNAYVKNFQKYKENQMLKSRHGKQLFNYISKRVKDSNKVPVLEKDQKTAISDDAKVEMLADAFYQSFNTQNYNTTDTESNSNQCEKEVRIKPIYSYMVLKEIKKIKSSAAPVPDGLPGVILKNCAENISTPLAVLFQTFFNNGKVPSLFRKGYVIPLSKKPPYSDPLNYRPITMTSQVCRINERIIAHQLLDHCLENNIIPPCQYGFRPQRSTTLQIALCREWWFQTLERKDCIDVIYLDFAKAFDSVPHKLLLAKLQKIGVKGNLLHWITNFLSDRSYTVTIGDSKSTTRDVPSGVPQGTVLGPLLFSIYLSDLPDCITDKENIRLDLFADDSKVSFRFNHKTFNPRQLNETLQNIHEWCLKWGLNLAASKTTVLHLGKNNPEHEYEINGVKLVPQEEVRDLGIIMKNNLSMNSHINKIVAASSQKLYLLFKILKNCNPDILVKAYTSYVRPILESSSTLFSPKEANLIDLIESVQRKATKRIFYRCKSKLVQSGQEIPEYSQRCQILKLQTLESRRLEADAVFGIRLLQNPTIDSTPFIRIIVTKTRAEANYRTPGKATISNHFYSTIPRICRYMPSLLAKNPNILQLKTSCALKHHVSEINLAPLSNTREYRFAPVNIL